MLKHNMEIAESFGIESFVNDTKLLESEKTERAKQRWLEFWDWVKRDGQPKQ